MVYINNQARRKEVTSLAGENSTFLGEHISVIKVFGLTFNVGNLVAGTLAAAIEIGRAHV